MARKIYSRLCGLYSRLAKEAKTKKATNVNKKFVSAKKVGKIPCLVEEALLKKGNNKIVDKMDAMCIANCFKSCPLHL